MHLTVGTGICEGFRISGRVLKPRPCRPCAVTSSSACITLWGFEFRVSALGFRVWGLEFEVWGLGFRV